MILMILVLTLRQRHTLNEKKKQSSASSLVVVSLFVDDDDTGRCQQVVVLGTIRTKAKKESSSYCRKQNKISVDVVVVAISVFVD